MVLLLGHPLPSGAQTPSERVHSFGESASGFTLVGNVETGALRADREMQFPVQLAEGSAYMVVGYCDNDCSDLDLVLLDPQGMEVTSDLLPDAEPVLSLTAEASGEFRIRVIMVNCSAEPCGYAIGVYSGAEGGLGPDSRDMDATMREFQEDFRVQGFTGVGGEETGALQEGQEMRFSLSLQAGQEYRVLGVCDQDCDDLDLRLFDPGGTEVDSDLLRDAVPLLEISPSTSGEYRVAVLMVGCSIEPCGFRVATFAKGEGVGPGGAVITGTVVSDITHRGTLGTGDQRLREGEYYDEYTVQAQAGQKIILDLRSDEIDTYLILEAPGGATERNDDYEEDAGHSHIEWVAAETGTYSILVTSFSAAQTGSYQLRAVVTEGS